MIVVGILGAGAGGDAIAEIARRAAATGARTEVVGAAPVGPAGDRLLLQLAKAGVGHATVTRAAVADDAITPPEPAIEPADLELALRYLPDVRVIVLTAPPPALLAVAAAAAGFAGARLVLTAPVEAAALDSIATLQPIVLEPPAHDPDGAFAGLVATLAARLDAGTEPGAAWKATLQAHAVDPIF